MTGVPVGWYGIGFIVLAIVSAYFFGAAPVLEVLEYLGLGVLGLGLTAGVLVVLFWLMMTFGAAAASARFMLEVGSGWDFVSIHPLLLVRTFMYS